MKFIYDSNPVFYSNLTNPKRQLRSAIIRLKTPVFSVNKHKTILKPSELSK